MSFDTEQELCMEEASVRLHLGVLAIDCRAETDRISACLVDMLAHQLRRRGVVLGLSGGVDSSVCAALAVRAFGPDRVFGLLMPERDSSDAGASLGRTVAEHLGIRYLREDIAPALEAMGCYRRRDEAIRALFPDYRDDWKSKIVVADGLNGRLSYFKLVVQAPDGGVMQKRMPAREYLQIVAATSYKQRLRKTVEYYHADRLHYAVLGTPNRLEYDQGFFVKNGDGSADIKPIAHLYKTQVYALARYLGLPEAVCNARPTTDTYSMAQGQDEFYFVLPYEKMDIALWARNHGVAAGELAACLEISEEQAGHIYANIDAKRRTTAYLHLMPLLVEPVFEIPGFL